MPTAADFERALAQLAKDAERPAFADRQPDIEAEQRHLNSRLRALQTRADNLARTMVAAGAPAPLVGLAFANTAVRYVAGKE